MKTVKQLLHGKSHALWSISPDAMVFEAIKLMADRQIGALMVVEDARPVGIITERDYATKLALHDKSSRTTPVREVMTDRVLFVTPAHALDDCMALMNEHRIRHLPVLDQGQLVGVLSIRDLVQAIIEDRQFMIQQLENYITGNVVA